MDHDAYWSQIDGQDRAPTCRPPRHTDGRLVRSVSFQPVERLRADSRTCGAVSCVRGAVLIIGPWVHARTVKFPDGAKPRNFSPGVPGPQRAVVRRTSAARRYRHRPGSSYEIYVMGTHQWRDEQEWPLARTRYTAYYLHSEGHANTADGDGVLTTSVPETRSRDTYAYDPDDRPVGRWDNAGPEFGNRQAKRRRGTIGRTRLHNRAARRRPGGHRPDRVDSACLNVSSEHRLQRKTRQSFFPTARPITCRRECCAADRAAAGQRASE